MSAPSVAQLLQSNRARIAYAIARQVQSTVPKYRSLDTVALGHNIESIIESVALLLESGDVTTLMRVIGMTMDLRQVAGFTVSDFLVATLCGLPVLRRFLVAEAASIETGLDRYEQVERVVLPLYGRVVADFLRGADEVVTVPEKMSPLEALKSDLRSGDLFAYEIVAVDRSPIKLALEDDTDPGRRRPSAAGEGAEKQSTGRVGRPRK